MSEQVSAPVAENQNQVASDIVKTIDPPVVAPVAAAPVDSITAPVVEVPKAEEAPVQEIVYEIKQADGSLLDAAQAEKIVSFAKENKLSSAQAQAIYDRENAAVTAFATEQENQYNERKSQWVDAVKNDKEIGGDNFKTNITNASNVLKKFASPEFIKTLDDTGLGNHPELIRIFSRIAKTMQPDSFVHGSSIQQGKSITEVLYDKTK